MAIAWVKDEANSRVNKNTVLQASLTADEVTEQVRIHNRDEVVFFINGSGWSANVVSITFEGSLVGGASADDWCNIDTSNTVYTQDTGTPKECYTFSNVRHTYVRVNITGIAGETVVVTLNF